MAERLPTSGRRSRWSREIFRDAWEIFRSAFESLWFWSCEVTVVAWSAAYVASIYTWQAGLLACWVLFVGIALAVFLLGLLRSVWIRSRYWSARDAVYYLLNETKMVAQISNAPSHVFQHACWLIEEYAVGEAIRTIGFVNERAWLYRRLPAGVWKQSKLDVVDIQNTLGSSGRLVRRESWMEYSGYVGVHVSRRDMRRLFPEPSP